MSDSDFSDENILVRLKHLPQTIECGIHSGIPPCCIKFFVCQKLWMSPEDNSKYAKRIKQAERYAGKSIHYVPCPECLRNKTFKEILPCDTNETCQHTNNPEYY